ncbi:MAG: chorismate-binding protein [Bdellovibrionota bacterium]
MSKQPNISTDMWAKILRAGAFLRWQGKWWFYQLPMSAESREKTYKYYILKPDFFDLNKGFLKVESIFGPLSTDELKTSLLSYFQSQKENFPTFFWHEHSNRDFNSCFQSIHQKIMDGIINKAVPMSFLEGKGKVESLTRAQLILRLLEAPETLIPYGVWDEDQGFLGATPEILFERKEDQFQTMALAGTAVQDFSGSQDFLTDSKENQEHQFVVQDILKQLKDYVTLIPEKTRILELPHLRHLLTPMGCRIKKKFPLDDLELIKIMHPTAALGVFPRNAGLVWLKELPGQGQRGSFGAPVSFPLSENHVVVVVGLRRLEWNQENIRIGAGCGLVSESIFEREWDEVNRKIDSVRKLLGI